MLHYLWHKLRDLLYLAVYDEVAGQRALAATMFGVAMVLEQGGLIPGTGIVIPLDRLFGPWGQNWLSEHATVFKMVAIWIASGHGWPTLVMPEEKKPAEAPARP